MARRNECSHEEVTALLGFAIVSGRCWKAALSKQWQAAHYPGVSPDVAAILQGLRNASYFGPRGLKKVRINFTLRRINGI